MEGLLEQAGALGVGSASWIAVRLPHEVAPLFREWLEVHFPDRAGKVMAIVQSMRGGRDNDPEFFTRMKPQGVWADLIRTRFRGDHLQLIGFGRHAQVMDIEELTALDAMWAKGTNLHHGLLLANRFFRHPWN